MGIGSDTKQDETIYDPTCGSGSLLIRAADEAPNGITIYGQEMDNATWSLAKMNTLLHGHPTAELWQGNTLADPYFKNPDNSLKTFDFAVANPPFSDKSLVYRLEPRQRRVPPLRVWRSTTQERGLCLYAAFDRVSQEQWKRRHRNAARCAVPWQ